MPLFTSYVHKSFLENADCLQVNKRVQKTVGLSKDGILIKTDLRAQLYTQFWHGMKASSDHLGIHS